MKPVRVVVSIVAVIWLAQGCGSSPPAIQPLPPAETFTWVEQPISFSPPPDGWERQPERSGGLFGVRFVKAGSVGEVIGIAESTALGDRDRCTELRYMLAELDELDQAGFAQALRNARPDRRDAINGHEAGLALEADRGLDLALESFDRGDTGQARLAIESALKRLGHIRYSVDDVVDMVARQPHRERGIEITLGERKRLQIGTDDAIVQEFTVTSTHTGLTYAGRDVYVVHNNRLFVISFQGLEENVELFGRIVASISFPPGGCEH